MVISYSVAAAAALLSGLCYTEFTVDLPTAGGAFNYVAVVFGEFTAWCAAVGPCRSCTRRSWFGNIHAQPLTAARNRNMLSQKQAG